MATLKLNVGCGNVYFPGWVNIDIEAEGADLKHDLREPLPYEDNAAEFIYNEHFIEHLTVQEGEVVLKDFYRVLKKGGVLRVATLDLDYIVYRYCFNWKRQAWISNYGYEWLETKAEMINLCFREWGHQYLYNREELERRLRKAGFAEISRNKIYKSIYPELSNRETRADSKLVLEAVK